MRAWGEKGTVKYRERGELMSFHGLLLFLSASLRSVAGPLQRAPVADNDTLL